MIIKVEADFSRRRDMRYYATVSKYFWSAGDCGYGFGATKEEAIKEAKENYWEEKRLKELNDDGPWYVKWNPKKDK